MTAPMPLPDLVAHDDWSVHPKKRWMTVARREGRRGYRVGAPERVGEVGTLIGRLTAEGRVLLGLDLPLGVPRAWAGRAGIASFSELLRKIGQGDFQIFAETAEKREEIGVMRPFYPRRPGRKGTVVQRHLVDALGLAGSHDLYRRCDLAQPGRARASPLFWTLGAKQVGRAALSAWCDLVRPSLNDLALWPFDGSLDRLLPDRLAVVAETYPAEAQAQLGLSLGRTPTGSKRRQVDRMAFARDLLAAAARLDVVPEPAAVEAIETGFGSGSDGEDRYDSMVGLLGMLQVLRTGRCPLPDDAAVRTVEGWILGQVPVVDRAPSAAGA